MPNDDVPVDDLRSILRFEPDTGALRWIDRRLDALSRGSAGFVTSAGYRGINIHRVRYQAHRVAWALHWGAWPVGDIDHINGVKLDNRLCNLRDVPHRTNSENSRVGRRGGLLGTAYHRQSEKWRAIIGTQQGQVTLGYFQTPEEAHAAYLEAKRRLHAGCTI